MLEKIKNWPARNADYYKRNFQALNNGKRAQFNWGAFLFGPAWWAYRKMYGAALVVAIIFLIIHSTLSYFDDSVRRPLLIGSLVLEIVIAYYANTIYQKYVKFKIQKGYNQLEEYNTTSFALALLVYLSPIALKILGILLFAVADYYSNPFQQEKQEKFEATNDAVNQYLDRKNPEHPYGRKFTIVLYILAAIVFTTSCWEEAEKNRRKVETHLNNLAKTLAEN